MTIYEEEPVHGAESFFCKGSIFIAETKSAACGATLLF
jgi:hypothetical protein